MILEMKKWGPKNKQLPQQFSKHNGRARNQNHIPGPESMFYTFYYVASQLGKKFQDNKFWILKFLKSAFLNLSQSLYLLNKEIKLRFYLRFHLCVLFTI